MGSYSAYLRERMARGFTLDPTEAWRSFNRHFNNSHGGDRFDFSNDPFYGRIKKYTDKRQEYEDYYQNTGMDQKYASKYGGNGFPFVNDALSGLGVTPMRMAKSLSKIYGCEVLLDITKERKELEQMRAVNRYNYMVGSHALADHWIDYANAKNR